MCALTVLNCLCSLDSDKESIKLWRSLGLLGLSLSLGGDNSDDLFLLVEGATLGAESLAGELDRVLFLSLVSGFNHFHHLAFIGGLAADLADDGANGSNSGVETALAVGGLVLLLISSLLELGDNETLVKTDVETTLCQLLYHLVTLK